VDRHQAIEQFLAENGWGGAQFSVLSADASFRHYYRVTGEKGIAVLMDAPPDKEPVAPFLKVAGYLLKEGFSAPQILAKDQAAGFLLLEDLGDLSYTRLLKQDSRRELAVYKEAINVLVALHQREADGFDVPQYNQELYLREVELFIDWCLAPTMPKAAVEEHRAQFLAMWRELLSNLPFFPDVLVLRDYHADNLMWLDGRSGIDAVGLLDFQDAVLGNPAYDLVSLLEDARRDIQPETVQVVLNYYLQQMGWDKQQFMAWYAVLGAQRNTKIIGIFNRLNHRDGKPHYLNYLPRVWQHLQYDLTHPLLKSYREWMQPFMPEFQSEEAGEDGQQAKAAI